MTWMSMDGPLTGIYNFFSSLSSSKDDGDFDTKITVTKGNVISWPYVALGAIGAYFVLKKRGR